MFYNEGEQLLIKLQQLFGEKEVLISTGRVKVCLTATVISFLNKCFDESQQYLNYRRNTIEYLKRCVQTVQALKITAGPTFKFTSAIDISNFQSAEVLEISKLAIGYISGLQNLRRKIKFLKIDHSVDKINDVLALCGFDQSIEFAWPQLEVADFSYNAINHLDSSLRLLTSVQVLNLSHNELVLEEENWKYLPEVACLDIGHNQITKIPLFTENCSSKITTLILKNNDLSSLEGLEVLSNLETLDVSFNCITTFNAISPLASLSRLVKLDCFGNPVSYHKNYRITIISCMSPSPRNVPIFLDGRKLGTLELHKLGSSFDVDLSNYLPARPSGSPVLMPHAHQDSGALLHSSTEQSMSSTPDEKNRGRKIVIRHPAICNAGEEKASTSYSNSIVEETSEELEKLEKFKKDTGEDYLVVRNQEKHEHIKERTVASNYADTTDTSPLFDQKDATIATVLPESPVLNNDETQSNAKDEENGEIFIFTIKLPTTTGESEPKSDDLFVIVNENFIVEKSPDSKVICKLDLNSLVEVNVVPLEKAVVVQLKFDSVKKEKQFREYIVDDEKSCDNFVGLIKDFVRDRENEKTSPRKKFKCLKCSAMYTVDEEITVCSYCDSSIVVEVAQDEPAVSSSPSSKTDPSRLETSAESPDLIPRSVNEAGVTPDVCINSCEKDKSYLSAEYGAVVSTITLKNKITDEGDFNNVDEGLATDPSNLSERQSSPSAAMNISLDRFSPGGIKNLYHRLKRESGNTSPLDSTASSSSASGSQTSTSVEGVYFSVDACTHCDHRLKLYFETKMFKGGDEEEFHCMIKCPVVSYGFSHGIPSLLVASNITTYICKITGFESIQPKEWLSVRYCYPHTDLRYIEYGLQSQSFRLEFSHPSGCHTYLVGDTRRCEQFVSTLRAVVKKACLKENVPSLIICKANPQTLANIRIQVFGIKDESLVFKGRRLYQQAVNFTDPPLIKDRKSWFRSYPQSMLGIEFMDWLISRKEASNFHDAVQVGQLLLDAGVIKCFNQDCRFLETDEYYYFSLSEDFPKTNVNNSPQNDFLESNEVDTTIKLYFLGYRSTLSKKKDNENVVPVSIILTNSHVALAEENHQWPLPRFHEPPPSLSGPQFVYWTKQKITNITDVELFSQSPRDIGIEFCDEDTPGNIEDDHWLLVMETEHSLSTFLDGIKELWERRFGVEIPVVVTGKVN